MVLIAANQHSYCQSTIKNQQSKLFRTIFPDLVTTDHVITDHVATAASAVQAKAKPGAPDNRLWQATAYLTRLFFQYSRRGSVTVACAAQPCFRSLVTAALAASFEANSPYSVDPEP